MKNFIRIFFIGLLFFSNLYVFALTEEEKILEGQKIVAELEKEQKNEKGIYFFDSVKKEIVKWFNYNDEFDSTSSPQILENGGKAVYSIGDKIFFKEFSKGSFPNNENEDVGDFGNIEIDENSVKLFSTESQGNNLILSWKDEEKFDGYVIQIKDNIDGFLDGDSKSLIYFLKKEGIKYSLDFGNSEKFFLTEKIFSEPELEIFLNENFFYAKIFGIKDGKISTGSAQKIILGDKKNILPKKNSTIEKLKFPILVDNILKVSDLFLLNTDNGDDFAWDFDGDGIFEKQGDKVFLPAQNDLNSFFIDLEITKKSGKKIINKIQIDFFVPKIFFDRENNGRIFGHIDPIVENFPVFYSYENEEYNKRYGMESLFTNEFGKFNFLKKSGSNSRKIFLANKKIIGEIFSEEGSVSFNSSESAGDFLTIFDGTKVVALIYINGKVEFYDKSYFISLNMATNIGTDFFIKKNGESLFYFNF